MKLSRLLLALLLSLQGFSCAADALEDQVKQAVYAENPAHETLDLLSASKNAPTDAYQRLIDRYHTASERGDAEAAYRLAVIYRHGLGVAIDSTESLRQYKLAAERGHLAALTALALLYETGKAGSIPSPIQILDIFRRNDARAVELLRQAAAQNHAPAQFALSRFYLEGRGIAKDPQEGERLLQAAAEQNHIPAVFALAVHYDNAQDGSGGHERTLYWFEKSAVLGDKLSLGAIERRADGGSLKAIKLLAGLYESGRGVGRDYARAAQYWQRAAQKPDAEALYRLGLLAERGQALAYTDLQYFQLAVRHGYAPALERINARILAGDLHAQYVLAEMYLTGDGVELSKGRAIKLLQLGAKSGYSHAFDKLANLADGGEPGLALFLAYLYENGIGTEASMTKAVSWWRKAADQGAAQGKYRLAQLLEGVPESIQLYLDIFRQGNPVALEPLDRLAKTGNPLAQKALGDALAQGFDSRQQQASNYLYVVASGDTLSELAERLGMGLSVLQEANPQIADQHLIRQGDTLQLPLGKTSFHPRLLTIYLLDAQGRGSPEHAEQWWKAAATQGLQDAALTLGRHFEQRSKADEALNWYVPLARKGHAVAIQRIQHLAMAGQPRAILEVCELISLRVVEGSPLVCWTGAQDQGIPGAFKEIEAMAVAGNSEARYALGKAFFEGTQVAVDHSQAERWLSLASEQGHAKATVLLAEVKRGLADHPGALKLYRKAAMQGNPQGIEKIAALAKRNDVPALLEWADMKFSGAGTPVDTAGAWLLLESAARQGDNAAAEKLVGHFDAQGQSQRAMDMLVKAAKRGSISSMENLVKRARAGNAVATALVTDLQRIRGTPNDLTAWLVEIADKGDIPAMLELVDRFQKGEGAISNQQTSLSWLKRAADAGNAAAQLRLARWLESPSFPLVADLRAATVWYALLSRTGEPEAIKALLRLSEGPQAGPAVLALAQHYARQQQQIEASRFYKKAAEQGQLTAMLELAQRFDEGIGLIKSQEIAYEWRLKAAEANDTTAQMEVAFAYRDGTGFAKNLTEWMRWLSRAAQQGNALAQYELGQAYLNGDGVAVNEKIGLDWTEKAAQQGDVNAQRVLGQVHFDKGNYTTALSWLTLATKQNDAQSQGLLGQMYEGGLGVMEEPMQALKLYTVAADKGQPLAQFRLGRMYLDGRHVPVDIGKGIALVEAAAEDNIVDAQFLMAHIYFNKKHTPQDLPAGLSWLGRAARNGHITAQQELLEMHAEGFETGMDDSGAFTLARCMVSEPTLPKDVRYGVWYVLAKLYAAGRGTEVNKVQAHCGYNLAAAEGSEGAALALRELEKTMEAGEVREAERCARAQIGLLETLGGKEKTPASISPCPMPPQVDSDVSAKESAKAPLVVPIEHNHFYIDIGIGSADAQPFMIDSGATSLTFDTATLEASGAAYQVIDQRSYARLADGKVIAGQKIRLTNVTVGDLELKDVRAFVCETCLPLAGQSVLRHFNTETRIIEGTEHMILSPRL